MKIIVIRAVLWILIIFLGYKIFDVVYSDIHFAAQKARKESARADKMEKIRELQFVYRDEYRRFAKNWNELIAFADSGYINVVKVIGDPNDTAVVVQRDTTKITVLDSVFGGNTKMIDTLPHIPFAGEFDSFKVQGDKINLRSVMVDVMQITDTKPIFQDPEQTEANGPDEEPLQIGKMYTANYDLNRDPRQK
ncbi:MAG: hypothetical protein ACPGLV_05080 [Bacteroidia bacterium]